MIEQVPDLPSIVSKARIYPMPVITMTGKPAKEKSPVGEHPTGLLKQLKKQLISNQAFDIKLI
jgi:hypothetical protein